MSDDNQTITIELDDARDVMYSELNDLLGEQVVDAEIESQLIDVVTEMYDNREQLKQQLEQQRQQQRQ